MSYQFTLKPISAAPVACKICDNATGLYGVVDFNKSCEELRGSHLPLSGVPVYYRRCGACGFLFTDAFDDWSESQFRTHIYNDDYIAVDPDYQTTRPNANAIGVAQLWDKHKAGMRVLDFGGGNDVFCSALRANGFPVAVTYDPMVPEHATPPGRESSIWPRVSKPSSTSPTPMLPLPGLSNAPRSRERCSIPRSHSRRTSTDKACRGGMSGHATAISLFSPSRRWLRPGPVTATRPRR